jgi:hypothetical protein
MLVAALPFSTLTRARRCGDTQTWSAGVVSRQTKPDLHVSGPKGPLPARFCAAPGSPTVFACARPGRGHAAHSPSVFVAQCGAGNGEAMLLVIGLDESTGPLDTERTASAVEELASMEIVVEITKPIVDKELPGRLGPGKRFVFSEDVGLVSIDGMPQPAQPAGTHSGFLTALRFPKGSDTFFAKGTELIQYEGIYLFDAEGQAARRLAERSGHYTRDPFGKKPEAHKSSNQRMRSLVGREPTNWLVDKLSRRGYTTGFARSRSHCDRVECWASVRCWFDGHPVACGLLYSFLHGSRPGMPAQPLMSAMS